MKERETRAIAFTFVFLTKVLCFVAGEEGPCKRLPYGCCAHTKWDLVNLRCVECQRGYYGYNCSWTCPYPLYGRLCEKKCSCRESLCDFANGCREENLAVTSTLGTTNTEKRTEQANIRESHLQQHPIP